MVSILQVCAVDFTARRFLLPLMRAERAAGFDVHLACAPGNDAGWIAQDGFPVYPIPFRRSMNLYSHLRAYFRLRKLMRQRPFSIVHAHTPIAAMIARVAARKAGVPLVLYTAHGFYFHEGMRPTTRRVHIALERWAQRYADFLFTQSREDLDDAIKEKIAPAERAMAIGNGVEVGLFERANFSRPSLDALRAEFGFQGKGPIITMIGRLVREKGYFEFLEAMASVCKAYPEARALVVGDALASDHDDSAAQIKRRAAELGLGERLHFAGLRNDVPRLLALSDIFCLPSWREGMPRSIIEAMASGLPVVATRIRGCREEVLDEQTGLLVPVRDAPALGGALMKLAGDADLRRRMGQAGKRRACDLYDERKVIDRQLVTMRKLLHEKGLDWPKG